jgi:carboxyl-terminal processing protease
VDGRYLDLPIAVVVNQNSASAAEIVAACLQDHDRAIVAGERTYGKGTVQQLVPLESGRSLLKLTWASFWRPSGARIHRPAGTAEDDTWGVAPTARYERPLSPEEYAAYRKYRTDRDLATPRRRSDEPEKLTPTDDFTDEQLEVAVDHLHGEFEPLIDANIR